MSQPECPVSVARGGTLLYESATAGTAQNTQMCWSTSDLDADVAELRQRGVVFEEYDLPGLRTENGIAFVGTERSAWFKDTEGNTICISETIADDASRPAMRRRSSA